MKFGQKGVRETSIVDLVKQNRARRNDLAMELLDPRLRTTENRLTDGLGDRDLDATGSLDLEVPVQVKETQIQTSCASYTINSNKIELHAEAKRNMSATISGDGNRQIAKFDRSIEKSAVYSAPGGQNPATLVLSGAVLEIDHAVPSGNFIQFDAGYGTLKLDMPEQFRATIVGFTGTAPIVGQSDIIDLAGVGTLNKSNLSYSASTGVLTVTSDTGMALAELTLVGSYSNASFDVSSDGFGGSNIFDPTLNPIVIENMLAGTPMSVWSIKGNINNKGDDDAIQGFATSMSINPGQTENFKIDTNATQYVIDIYRLGYYGGNGARLISTQAVRLSQAQIQPTPLFDPLTRQVDAGNWSISAAWAVPTNAVSGVYFAKLTTLNGAIGQNMIPFVVTNGGAVSPMTFQTNDSSWEAYNPWGGYNLYTGPTGLATDRAYAVSYNRPIDINSTSNLAGPQDFVFGAEYATIYWLEANGYNVSYVTSGDVANQPGLLNNTKVYVDTGHDEYWSQSQYDNVLAAENAGVSVASLSGNQVYWDISYSNGLAGSSNTTIVEYKDPWAGAQIDPNSSAGGGASTFQDPVNGPGTPQNALMGNIFQVDAAAALGNITIPYNLSKFRFWNNTGVASLQPGQAVTLFNLLGYEWNTDNNNGFRPAGVIDLSSTTTNVGTLILGQSGGTGSGEATHSLTLFRNTASGALIFDAGTVMWSWGLDIEHAYYNGGQTAPVSATVEQAMVNLFADMGVQPQTLMASLVYASGTSDTTAPVSKITSIGPKGTFLSNEIVTVSGTALDSGGGQVAMVEISTNGGVTWNRAVGFANWTYSWIAPTAGNYTLETRATNDSAYLETPSDATTVTVEAGPTSSLFTSSPGDVIRNSTSSDNINSGDPSAVELGLRFVASANGLITGVRFWKDVSDTGGHTGSLWTATGQLLASGIFLNETASGWQTLVFASPVAITAGAGYVAGYHSHGSYTVDSNYFTAPVQNGYMVADTSLSGPGCYIYNTSAAFPSIAQTTANYWVDVVFKLSGVAEAPLANNDSVFAVIQNTALAIAASSLLSNDTDPNGLALSISAVSNPTGGAVTFDTATATVTFTPTADYVGAASFNYTITDSTGLTSTANVGLYVGLPIVDSLWTNSATPSALSTNDPNPVELGMRFVASTDGVITGLRYYKSALDTGTHVGSLWTSTGTLLASATFANETDSGWQTVNFASGVSIVAGTPYVAAYHSNGNYAASVGYFTSDYTNGPLTAPGGTNGVYTYSNTSVFPTSTYNGNNYWVDVLDRPSMLSPPVVPNASGFTTYENTAVIIAASTLLALDSDPNNLALSVSSVSSPTNGTVAFNSATGAITFTPTASYTGSAGFSYTVSDTAGLTTSASVALTVNAPAPPVVNADSGFIATENQALSIAASGLLANDTDPNGLALSLSGVSNPSNGTVSFNAATNMVIFTPTTDYVGPASFTYTVADIAGATASGAVSLTVSPPAGAAAITQLYENILGRSPDSGGLAFYTSLYNGGAGVGLAQIAQILAESSESVTRLSTLTLDVTGVAITDTQLASYQAQLASGTTLATVATPLVTQAQGEIDALYRQILNRGADSSGLAGYSSMVPNMAIQDATPIADIRSILAYSAEDTANLTSLFNLVYATNPSTAQLLGYETQLAAGTPFSNLQIVSDLRTQINGLYQQVLGRGADDTGMSTYTNQVIGGSSLHDVQVALADSPETQNNLERLYLDVLGRTIDPSGQVAYRGALENGTALKQVRLWLASSEESAGYISAAYSVGYGSAPSANVLTFIENQLAAVKGTGATGTTLSAITSSLAAPLVIDMAGNQVIDTHSTDQIFAAVTVTDPTTGPETATITLNDATGATDANGTLAGLSLTHVSAGIYTVTAGSAAALTSALDNLLFTPTTDSLTTVSVSVKNASDNLVGTGSTTITSSSLGLSGTPSFIYSSVGNDTFNGTALAGSAAPGNIFAFTATTDLGSTGNDIIANFSLSHDQLQLNIGRFANVAAVLAATNDSGTNAVITLDAASSITLVGVHKTDLSSTNFILRHTS